MVSESLRTAGRYIISHWFVYVNISWISALRQTPGQVLGYCCHRYEHGYRWCSIWAHSPRRTSWSMGLWYGVPIPKSLLCGSQMRKQFSPNTSCVSPGRQCKDHKVLSPRPWVQTLALLLSSCRTLARRVSSAVRWNHDTHPTAWGRRKWGTHTCPAQCLS